MNCRASCFNRGVAKNLLRRFWPLWLAYFALLLLSFTFPLLQQLSRSVESAWFWQGENVHTTVLQYGATQIGLSIFVAPLTVMAMYSYLYSSRSCAMMNALPVRRETLFCTAFLTGLLPLLLAQGLVMLLTAPLLLPYELPFVWLLEWLGLVAASMIAFYGFAVFCAMLTGNILVLPAVYLVLNLTVVAVELCVRALLASLLYGAVWNGETRLTVLSPIAYLFTQFQIYTTDGAGVLVVRGLGALIAYCAAGLLLSGLALLLYRRRQMESAGDVVAIPVLKPVFQYCMAVGTALVLPVLVGMLLGIRLNGRGLALLLMGQMLLGAFLGWYIAEMLLEKTLKVFFRRWKPLALVCAALLILALTAELDLFGYERRVPAAQDVERVELCGTALSEPENIEGVLALHRSLVEAKPRYDSLVNGSWMAELSYTLKDGRRLQRSYLLPGTEGGVVPAPSELLQTQALLNCPEGIMGRVELALPAEARYVGHAALQYDFINAYGGVEGTSLRLSPEQAIELYQKGILADAAEGTVSRYVLDDSLADLTTSNFSFVLTMEQEPGRINRYYDKNYTTEHKWFTLNMESAHSLDWIRANTELGEMICPALDMEPAEATLEIG